MPGFMPGIHVLKGGCDKKTLFIASASNAVILR
jgi:hypothetical protein